GESWRLRERGDTPPARPMLSDRAAAGQSLTVPFLPLPQCQRFAGQLSGFPRRVGKVRLVGRDRFAGKTSCTVTSIARTFVYSANPRGGHRFSPPQNRS